MTLPQQQQIHHQQGQEAPEPDFENISFVEHNDDTHKYQHMMMDYFPMERLQALAPAIATVIQQDQGQLPLPAELTFDALCLNAPTLNDLATGQRRPVMEILDAFGADLDSARALVTGGAGPGKSMSLKFFMRYAYENDMEPVLLALSGVAANHIYDHTVHRYLSISRTEGSGHIPECNPLRLTLRLEAIRARNQLPCIPVDEASMVSHQMLQVMSQTFRQATGDERSFGN
ncbi:hypothetical protein BGX26_006136, partial [Mortierella sp. AD094]